MTIRRLNIIVSILLSSFSLLAQKPCLQAEKHALMMTQNEEYYLSHHELEEITLDAQMQSGLYKMEDEPLLTIPVVFHIIHQGGTGNIPNQNVFDALNLLNAAFRNAAPYGPNSGTDVEIEFCLASQDPNGIPTTGINRVLSPLADHNSDSEEIALKDLSRWNPYLYLNIWTVASINNDSIAGYSYLSSAHGLNVDGIVIDADYISNDDDDMVILAHEVGHYLNLYHTFEQGCTNSDCLIEGDRVCDTPPDNSVFEAPTCTSINSCATDGDASNAENPFTSDVDDQTQNFLDYSYSNCIYKFTDGQKTRMRTALLNTRNSILQSPACGSQSALVANFEIIGTVCQSDIISIQNISIGNATSYYWSFPGGSPSNSTDENPQVSYNFEGNFDITLTVSDGSSSHTITKSNYVNVENCCSDINFTYTNGVSYSSALINWSSVTNAQDYTFRIRASGSSVWTNYISSTPYIFMADLNSCTEYEYQVGVVCPNNPNPNYSSIFSFTTDGCSECPAIQGIYAFNTTNISSLITWDVQSLADNYTLQYKKSTESSWTEYTNHLPIVLLFFLDPCSVYQFRVKAECDGLEPALFSTIGNFNTDCKGETTIVQSERMKVKIYPNPAEQFLQVYNPFYGIEDSKCFLTDSKGKSIAEIDINNPSTLINIEDLISGMYFLTISRSGFTESIKFIKK